METADWPVPGNAQEFLTPALLFDKDKINDNIKKTIRLAGGAERLWVHIKTHKTGEIIQMARAHGITRFKAATLAEAALLADCGAEHILLAFPLVGPAQKEYCRLAKNYPSSAFYAIGDDIGQLALFCKECRAMSLEIPYLVDVNAGTDRTGVRIEELSEFVEQAALKAGQRPAGLHCYDGHLGMPEEQERQQAVKQYRIQLEEQTARLERKGFPLEIRVMGGSPTMRCHEHLGPEYLSPGTTFLWDVGYGHRYRELPFEPAAAVLTRVVSRPEKNLFTLDLGYKGISADPPDRRGEIAGLPHAISLFQNEEHWTFYMEPGYEEQCPQVGTLLCVIPTHICSTCVLYDHAEVISEGKIRESWKIAARDRFRRMCPHWEGNFIGEEEEKQ